jgi:hypothetical protein
MMWQREENLTPPDTSGVTRKLASLGLAHEAGLRDWNSQGQRTNCGKSLSVFS